MSTKQNKTSVLGLHHLNSISKFSRAKSRVTVDKNLFKNCGQAHNRVLNVIPPINLYLTRRQVQDMGSYPQTPNSVLKDQEIVYQKLTNNEK